MNHRAAKLSALALIMFVLSAMAAITPAMAADTIHPDTTILTGPFGTVGPGLSTFTFNASEPSTFTCKLDLNSWSACTSPKTYPSQLADGTHTFQVAATDLAGNVDTSPATRTWKIDTTAPQTTILTGALGPVNSTTATFTFSSNETPATFECAFDGGGFSACSSPKSYFGIFDGPHTFSVRASDGSTPPNVDATPATRDFFVDTQTPDTVVTSATPGVNDTSATFTFVANDPAPSSGGITFQCKLDASAFAPCTSPKIYVGPLADGDHTFQVEATDAVGQTDFTPATVTWTKDTTAPDTILDATGPTGSTNDTGATFTFHSTELNSTFACRLDGGGFGACTSPQSYAGLADGTHTFYVQATDATGHTDATPATRTWKIDNTPPDTAIYSGPGGTVSSSVATFTFDSTEPGTFQCRLNGALSWTACTSPATYGGLADGDYTFEVQAIDAAGNPDPTPALRAWTILGGDTTAPTTVIDSGPTGTVPDTSATFTFHASEAATFQCALDAGAFSACSSPKVYAGPLAAGSHTFSVKATDASLNVGAAATRTWSIGKVPTSLTINAPAKAKHGTRVTVSGVLSSTDPTCMNAQKVTLKAGTATLGPRTTSATGAYSFSVYIGTSNKGVAAKYAGTTKCAASSSPRLIITST